MIDYTELAKELRDTERVCRDRIDGQVMLDAADAIEVLQVEVQFYKELAYEWKSSAENKERLLGLIQI